MHSDWTLGCLWKPPRPSATEYISWAICTQLNSQFTTEFCVPPTLPLSLHWLIFRVNAHLATAGWSRGLRRDRNLLPHHIYFLSLSQRAEWDLLSLIISKPKGPLLNKYHDQLWRNPIVITSAWACIEIGSHVSPWDRCLRGRTESAAPVFWKNQHLTKYPEICFTARSYTAPGWTKNSLLLWLPLALNLFTTPCWTAAKENKNIYNTCNCLVHILTFLFGGCFKLCSNIAGKLPQSRFPKRIHFTVLKLDTGCKNHTFEYFFSSRCVTCNVLQLKL